MEPPVINYRKKRVYAQTINVSLGFAFWAYNFSIFNTLQDYIQTFIFPGASTSAMSWIASSLDAGAIVGALIGGQLVAKLGRRRTMQCSDVVGVLGSSLTLVASLPCMIVGRVISGIVGGINTVSVAMYLVEMSPVAMTGVTGSMSIIILEIMAFMSLVAGYIVPEERSGGAKDQIWRILLFIPAFLNIIRFILMTFYFRYETPSYLIEKKMANEAMESLKSVYTSDVEDEYTRVAQDVYKATLAGRVRLRDLFSRTYRRAFAVGMTLAALQTFSGSTAVFVFSNTILEKSTSNEVLFTTLIAVINLVSVIVSFTFVEKLGRRTLILTGVICIGITVTIFGLIEVIDGETNPALKFILLIWPIFYQSSIGSLTYLYISETLPDIGVSVCTAINWTSGFIVSQFFLPVSENLGVGTAFLAFGVACFASSYFFYGNLMETKDKTRSQIMFAFNRMSTLKAGQLDVTDGIKVTEDNEASPIKSASSPTKSSKNTFNRLPSMYMRDRRGTVWATPGQIHPMPRVSKLGIAELEKLQRDLSEINTTKLKLTKSSSKSQNKSQISQSYSVLPATVGKSDNGEGLTERVPDTEESFVKKQKHRKSRSLHPASIAQIGEIGEIFSPEKSPVKRPGIHEEENEDDDSDSSSSSSSDSGSEMDARIRDTEGTEREEHQPVTFRASP